MVRTCAISESVRKLQNLQEKKIISPKFLIGIVTAFQFISQYFILFITNNPKFSAGNIENEMKEQSTLLVLLHILQVNHCVYSVMFNSLWPMAGSSQSHEFSRQEYWVVCHFYGRIFKQDQPTFPSISCTQHSSSYHSECPWRSSHIYFN